MWRPACGPPKTNQPSPRRGGERANWQSSVQGTDIWRQNLPAQSSKNALPRFCSVTGISSTGAIPQQLPREARLPAHPGQLPAQAQMPSVCLALPQVLGCHWQGVLGCSWILPAKSPGPRHPSFRSPRWAERAHSAVWGRLQTDIRTFLLVSSFWSQGCPSLQELRNNS